MCAAPAGWTLYLLACRRGAGTVYYAGITNDLPRRLQAHREGKGARFTRAHPPLTVLATRGYPGLALQWLQDDDILPYWAARYGIGRPHP